MAATAKARRACGPTITHITTPRSWPIRRATASKRLAIWPTASHPPPQLRHLRQPPASPRPQATRNGHSEQNAIAIMFHARDATGHLSMKKFFNPFPKYLQLREILRKRMQSDYEVGERLPTEEAICNEFAVSREKVR